MGSVNRLTERNGIGSAHFTRELVSLFAALADKACLPNLILALTLQNALVSEVRC